MVNIWYMCKREVCFKKKNTTMEGNAYENYLNSKVNIASFPLNGTDDDEYTYLGWIESEFKFY